MASDWRASTWGDEVTLEYGRALREYGTSPGRYRVFGSNGPIGWTNEALVQGPGVILGRKGAYRGVQYSPDPFYVIDTAYFVVPKSEMDMRWLYYAIQHHKLGEINDGSPIPSTTRSAVYVQDLDVPPPDEQRRIAHILGALDDKIELNRRMSETLEAIVRTLFKSWFVDFDPVRAKSEGCDPALPPRLANLFPSAFADSELGQIPRGWTPSSVGEVAEVIDCLHSKKPERRASGKPLIQLDNLRDDGLVDLSDPFLIDESDYKVWTSRIEARAGDCVITNVGRVGAVAQVPEGANAALGRNMTAIRGRSDFQFPTWLLDALRSDQMAEEISLRTDSGTILDALNVRNVPRLRIVLPAGPVLREYEELARPFRARMETLLRESHSLARVRDGLLPELIVGNVRVDPSRSFRVDS